MIGIAISPWQAILGGRVDAGIGGWISGLLLLDEPAWSSTVFLWKNFAGAAAVRQDEQVICVPFGDSRRYALYGFNGWAGQTAVNLGRLGEGIAARMTHHSNGSVVKVGTWLTTSDTGARGGNLGRAAIAGETIALALTGTSYGLVIGSVSNGGFATVAIDGDYTAATLLPAVTQVEVDAGYFASGDIGKRYIECYSAAGDYDRHVPIVEGLSNASRTITVRVQGTKRAASGGLRLYLGQFVAYDFTETLGAASALLFYTRDVTQTITDTYSSHTIVHTYNPATFSNPQFIGANHGNETFVSATFAVDAAPQTLAADAFASGTEATLVAVTTLTHPSISPTLAAERTVTFSGLANRVLQLQASVSTVWKNAGTLTDSYMSMLPVYYDTYPAVFNRSTIGNTVSTRAPSSASVSFGFTQSDVMAFYSTLHDFVAMTHVPNPMVALNGWAKSAPANAFIQHVQNSTDKAYFARSTSTNPETVAVDDVHTGVFGWRLRRIAGGLNRT